MSTATIAMARNGVDLPRLFDTVDELRAEPELGQFRFRATNRWVIGTHSRTTIETFTGAGGEHAHVREFALDADHPEVLTGADQGPTPLEYLLHALGACLVAGVANIASARGVPLVSVEARIEGDVDVSASFGLADDGRLGYEQLRVVVRIDGDAPPEQLREVVAQAQRRSSVLDVLTHGLDVTVAVETPR